MRDLLSPVSTTVEVPTAEKIVGEQVVASAVTQVVVVVVIVVVLEVVEEVFVVRGPEDTGGSLSPDRHYVSCGDS